MHENAVSIAISLTIFRTVEDPFTASPPMSDKWQRLLLALVGCPPYHPTDSAKVLYGKENGENQPRNSSIISSQVQGHAGSVA